MSAATSATRVVSSLILEPALGHVSSESEVAVRCQQAFLIFFYLPSILPFLLEQGGCPMEREVGGGNLALEPCILFFSETSPPPREVAPRRNYGQHFVGNGLVQHLLQKNALVVSSFKSAKAYTGFLCESERMAKMMSKSIAFSLVSCRQRSSFVFANVVMSMCLPPTCARGNDESSVGKRTGLGCGFFNSLVLKQSSHIVAIDDACFSRIVSRSSRTPDHPVVSQCEQHSPRHRKRVQQFHGELVPDVDADSLLPLNNCVVEQDAHSIVHNREMEKLRHDPPIEVLQPPKSITDLFVQSTLGFTGRHQCHDDYGNMHLSTGSGLVFEILLPSLKNSTPALVRFVFVSVLAFAFASFVISSLGRYCITCSYDAW